MQWKCASCKLARSDGCPPLATGIIWSITGLKGSGYLIDLSTC
nr:MAG TPA: hypothetical protein [Caudoviricetes sp.]